MEAKNSKDIESCHVCLTKDVCVHPAFKTHEHKYVNGNTLNGRKVHH